MVSFININTTTLDVIKKVTGLSESKLGKGINVMMQGPLFYVREGNNHFKISIFKMRYNMKPSTKEKVLSHYLAFMENDNEIVGVKKKSSGVSYSYKWKDETYQYMIDHLDDKRKTISDVDFWRKVKEMEFYGNQDEMRLAHYLYILYDEDIPSSDSKKKKSDKNDLSYHQCLGVTQKGLRCKRNTFGGIWCSHHEKQLDVVSLQCSGEKCEKRKYVPITEKDTLFGTDVFYYPCKFHHHPSKIKGLKRCKGLNKDGSRCNLYSKKSDICHIHKKQVGSVKVKCQECDEHKTLAVREIDEGALVYDAYVCQKHGRKKLDTWKKTFEIFKEMLIKKKISYFPRIKLDGLCYYFFKTSECQKCKKKGVGSFGYYCSSCSSSVEKLPIVLMKK